jgi:hypothetical protein
MRIYTPNLTHLLNAHGDVLDAKELRALRAIARTVCDLYHVSYSTSRREQEIKRDKAIERFERLTGSKP